MVDALNTTNATTMPHRFVLEGIACTERRTCPLGCEPTTFLLQMLSGHFSGHLERHWRLPAPHLERDSRHDLPIFLPGCDTG